MKILGITGGSGSGKTTLLRAVEHLGGLGLDCDAIYHCLLETDDALVAAIGARFPGTVRDGRVDRPALAAVVFADPAELAALDALTHEAVAREVRRRLWQSEAPFAAIDAIGLFESGLAALCDGRSACLRPRKRASSGSSGATASPASALLPASGRRRATRPCGPSAAMPCGRTRRRRRHFNNNVSNF